ncbi:MAG: Rdx family protein [Candidatus Desulfofervidaceae bacterium]|nr:Rdx family protein [Candidatus Desulfofervidaceae bacterium]
MVRIEFCGVCAGFRKEAETLAKCLKEQGTEVELIEAGRGRFNVYVDGELVFSIKKCKRYPRAKEIMQLIASR